MKDPLAAYLHDHLAGATFAVELLEALRDQHLGEPLGSFAAELLREIEDDRTALQNLAHEVEPSSNLIKETVTWLAEKASRLKLRRNSQGTLGTFESLEALSLGILGKVALWRALASIARDDPRVRGMSYGKLIERALEQHAKVEQRRIEAASIALAPSDPRDADLSSQSHR